MTPMIPQLINISITQCVPNDVFSPYCTARYEFNSVPLCNWSNGIPNRKSERKVGRNGKGVNGKINIFSG